MKEHTYMILNNEEMRDLKLFINPFKNNNIDEFEYILSIDEVDYIIIDDEIFEDIKDNNEFIENLLIIKELFDNNYEIKINFNHLNYYLYKRFININEYDILNYEYIMNNILLTLDKNGGYFYYRDDKLEFNYRLMNLIYNLFAKNYLFLSDTYEDTDYNIENNFLLDTYDYIDIFKHDDRGNYEDNYDELIDCINVYDDEDDFLEYILDLYEIDNHLIDYLDTDRLISDNIDDNYYFEYTYNYHNYIISQGYF